MENLPELLKIDEVSKILSMHPKTIRRYVQNNELKAVKIGKEYRIKVEDLKQFISKDEIVELMKVDGLEKVYSFLNGNYELKDGEIEVCSIVDIKADENKASEISKRLTDYINSNCSNIQYQYIYQNNKARYILFGDPLTLAKLLQLITK